MIDYVAKARKVFHPKEKAPIEGCLLGIQTN